MDSKKIVLAFALVAVLMIPAALASSEYMNVKVVGKSVDSDGDLKIVDLEDAEVTIKFEDDGDTNTSCHKVKTDGDGWIDSEGDCDKIPDEADIVELKVEHDDYLTTDVDNDDYDFLDDWDDNKNEILIVLSPKDELSIEIVVVDDDDDEISNVDVTVESLDKDWDADDFRDVADYEDADLVAFIGGEEEYPKFDYDEDESSDSDGITNFDSLAFGTRYKIVAEKSKYRSNEKFIVLGKNDDEKDYELELERTGTAVATVTVKDNEGLLVSNAEVTLVNKRTDAEYVELTSAGGSAVFRNVVAPDSYDIAITKSGYSTASDTDYYISLDGMSRTFILQKLTPDNRPPVLVLVKETYEVMLGTELDFADAIDVSDPDDDELVIVWMDSGIQIATGLTPKLLFDTAGEHKITVKVSDGYDEVIKIITINVISPDDCGDGICSIAEKEAGTCPEDCPVCADGICGAGEGVSDSPEYCPEDCNISLTITLGVSLSETLYVGNETTISAIDPATKAPILGATVKIITPNGSEEMLSTVAGSVDYTFTTAGTYVVAISADRYMGDLVEVKVEAKGNDLILWIVVIIVIVVAVFFIIRYMNENGGFKFGGKKSKGYRTGGNYKRNKSTLGSI